MRCVSGTRAPSGTFLVRPAPLCGHRDLGNGPQTSAWSRATLQVLRREGVHMQSAIRVGILTCGLIATVGSACAAERLDVKTGLWEVRTISRISGMPPLPKEVLDHLTPEQRTQMEKELKAAAGEAQTELSRECVTEKDLERPFDTADAEECEQTTVRTTRTQQEVRLVCQGDPKGVGTFRINTSDPETMDAELDLTVGEGAQAMRIQAEMAGSWIGPDCGEEGEYEDSDEEEPEED